MSCCKSRNVVEVIKQSHTKLRMYCKSVRGICLMTPNNDND